MDTDLPACVATLVGSLPHTNPSEAARLVVERVPEAPCLPELPRRGWREDMINSHTAGLPCLVEDESAGRCWVDSRREDAPRQLAAFYERVMAAEREDDLAGFALDSRHASALEPFAQLLKARPQPVRFLKLQCVGPVSFQLGLKDAEGRALFFDDTFQEVLSRQIELQARWLLRTLSCLGQQVLFFLDEPALTAFGSSALLGVSRQQVVERLRPLVGKLRNAGARVGIHVCGNTDWPMIIECDVDIINWDAYGYGERLTLYAGEVQRFLEKGGWLAWGIVPNDERMLLESPRSLEARWLELADALARQGPLSRRQILSRSLLTPACGLAGLAPEQAVAAIGLCADLAGRLREKLL